MEEELVATSTIKIDPYVQELLDVKDKTIKNLEDQINSSQAEFEMLLSQAEKEYASSATSTELSTNDYLFFIGVFLMGIFVFLLYKEITKLVYVRR